MGGHLSTFVLWKRCPVSVEEYLLKDTAPDWVSAGTATDKT